MLTRADRLPTGDAAAVLKVANLCAGREASADTIAGSAGRDVRFAAELLRLANSAFSAPREPIVSLPVAITRLGMSLVESLARAFSASGLLRGCPDPELAQRIHQHSVRTGVMAYAFADGGLSRDEALAAGLLQNTGLYLFAFAAPVGLKRLTFADYSDTLFYEREYEEACEVWANCYSEAERIAYIREHGDGPWGKCEWTPPIKRGQAYF